MQFISELFNQYGYIILFAALMLELIALPIPGEGLMVYCGFLVFEGKLNWGLSIIIASIGTILGITISYIIGKTLGYNFICKYGKYIHLTPKRINTVSRYSKKYGNVLLITALFIPGVRHITGYFSGITKYFFRRFALYSYLGVFIWTTTFISLGKLLGYNWESFHVIIEKYIWAACLALLMVGICIYITYRYRCKDYNIGDNNE